MAHNLSSDLPESGSFTTGIPQSLNSDNFEHAYSNVVGVSLT